MKATHKMTPCITKDPSRYKKKPMLQNIVHFNVMYVTKQRMFLSSWHSKRVEVYWHRMYRAWDDLLWDILSLKLLSQYVSSCQTLCRCTGFTFQTGFPNDIFFSSINNITFCSLMALYSISIFSSNILQLLEYFFLLLGNPASSSFFQEHGQIEGSLRQ